MSCFQATCLFGPEALAFPKVSETPLTYIKSSAMFPVPAHSWVAWELEHVPPCLLGAIILWLNLEELKAAPAHCHCSRNPAGLGSSRRTCVWAPHACEYGLLKPLRPPELHYLVFFLHIEQLILLGNECLVSHSCFKAPLVFFPTSFRRMCCSPQLSESPCAFLSPALPNFGL